MRGEAGYEEAEDGALDLIFGDEESYYAEVAYTTEYAAAVNYGADPHWPPMTPMVRWTNRMGWENYGLTADQPEDDLWAAVDERRSSGEDLPAAYHMASYVAAEGTEAMMFASDAFAEASRNKDAFAEENLDGGTSAADAALALANWSLELSNDNLLAGVSSASTGKLLQSMQPASLAGAGSAALGPDGEREETPPGVED